MKSAFSINVDFSKIFNAFENLNKNLNSFGNNFKNIFKNDNALTKALNNLPKVFDKIKNKLLEIKQVLADAFSPLKNALAGVGKLFSSFKNILMLPFNILSGVFNSLQNSISKIINETKGSLQRRFLAEQIRTDGANFRALERTEKLSGTQGVLLNIANQLSSSINSAEGQATFVGVGLNANNLREMDGIDMAFKVLDTLDKKLKNMGINIDSLSASELRDAIGDFGLNDGEMRAILPRLKELKAEYENQKKALQGSNEAMEKVEKTTLNWGFAFENWRIEFINQFGEQFSQVGNSLIEAINEITKTIFTDENVDKISDKLKELASSLSNFIKEDGLNKVVNTLKKAFNIAIRAMALFAKGAGWLAKLSGNISELEYIDLKAMLGEYSEEEAKRRKQNFVINSHLQDDLKLNMTKDGKGGYIYDLTKAVNMAAYSSLINKASEESGFNNKSFILRSATSLEGKKRMQEVFDKIMPTYGFMENQQEGKQFSIKFVQTGKKTMSIQLVRDSDDGILAWQEIQLDTINK